MGPFMEMHNADRSRSGYKRRNTKQTDELKEQNIPLPKKKLSFHLTCIRHSCSSPRSKSALKVHTHTHTDASLHWAVVACFVAYAHGLFPPSVLFIPSREREREGKKLIFIIFMLSRTSPYPLCLRERFCLPDRKHIHVISKGHLALTSLAI